METTTAPIMGGRNMAKKASTVNEQVKIDTDVVSAARIVCAYRKVQMAEYLSALLAPLVARDLAEEQAKATKEPATPARKPIPGQTSFIEPGKGRKGGAK